MDIAIDIEKKAFEAGFTHAVWIESIELEYDASLRPCSKEACDKFGTNWVCPPGSGSLEECIEKAKAFGSGILLQKVTSITPGSDEHIEHNKNNKLRLTSFAKSLENEGFKALALTGGGCNLCEECAYPAECNNPDDRLSALSASGINIRKLCEQAGLEFAFMPDKIFLTSLILANRNEADS
ncbi:MAG: DUF2284 domain-containing protein [Eubacteriaceae bacterium]|nr:DUF2284 domain-containing protein [Eubacteriaceae bacterium]